MKVFQQRQGSDADTHPDDEFILQAMAGRGEYDSSVRWSHEMCFTTAAAAQQARRRISAVGWKVDSVAAQPAPYPGWTLRASLDTTVTRTEVRAARRFFEAVAADTSGDYTGWDVRPVTRRNLGF